VNIKKFEIDQFCTSELALQGFVHKRRYCCYY